VGQHLVVGVGKAAPMAKLPLDELSQALLHRHQAAPRPLFSFGQPPRLRHDPTLPAWLTCDPIAAGWHVVIAAQARGLLAPKTVPPAGIP
jgi:hypothetical protein